jgi:hypothetical protein
MEDALAAHGLSIRGGFNFDADDAPPPGPSGNPARSLLLIGGNGPAFWPHFQAWFERRGRNIPEPLDSWSREVISQIGASFGARAVSPNDRPFLPFQAWAMRV